jgi:predicted DNA-binding protein
MPRPRSAKPVIRVTFELDPALVGRLNGASDHTGKPRWQIVTEALERYLPLLERDKRI